MILWIGILVGVVFAWFAIKIGFYDIWALLFNMILSIYLSIFMNPVFAGLIPPSANTPYNSALTVLMAAAGIFIILQVITYTFLTGQIKFSFPLIFDILGCGAMGFAAGLLIWSFIILIILISPVSQQQAITKFNVAGQFEQTYMPYLYGVCDLVNTVVADADGRISTKQAIDAVKGIKKEPAPLPQDPNVSAKSYDPISTKDPNESPYIRPPAAK